MDNKTNISKISELLDLFKEKNGKMKILFFSLAVNLIKYYKIEKQKNVQDFLKEYSNFYRIKELIEYDIMSINENDILGLIYQCWKAKRIKKVHTILQNL